jgi:alpha-tubulin suppressor-like RCC1 family protein
VPRLIVIYLALLLAACGGGGGGSSNNPPPQNGIGAAGGTVQGPSGSQVVIPAGALSQATAIAIDRSGAGAPPLPAGVQTVGDLFALTPHGTTFATPATIRFPFDPSRVPAGAAVIVIKTNAAQTGWEVVPGATFSGGMVSAAVSSFSWSGVVLGTPPPRITQQPDSITVAEGSGATFDVRVVSTFDPSYQWQRSNDGGVSFADIPGATQRSFAIGSVAASDTGAQFRVVVAVSGVGTTPSAVATLTVTPSSGPPVIVSQPQNRSVLRGTDATFAVTATGAGLQFQWSRAAGSGGNFTAISGATGPSYTLVNAQPGDTGSVFQVRVTNSLGSVTSAAAFLTVRNGGTITGNTIGAGRQHSVALLATGEIVSWGSNFQFQLGAVPANNMLIREVPGPVANLTHVVSIAVGAYNSIAFLDNGEWWGWGVNQWGELGSRGVLTREQPQRIAGVDGAIAACLGVFHSAFLFADGTVRTLGFNFWGQLGDGTTVESRNTPVTVLGIESAVAIACGDFHSLAVLADGSVRAWGHNDAGQLGNGTTNDSNVPVRVHEVVGATAVAAGGAHSLALVGTGGPIRAWGANGWGQLGDGTQTDRLIGVIGPGATAVTAGLVKIAAGGNTSMALQSDGDVFTWGANGDGVLGYGTVDEFGDVTPAFTTEAQAVDHIGTAPFETRVEEIAMSEAHMVVRGADGRVYTWGSNRDAQLGIGPVVEPFIFPFPQPVVDLDLD